MTELGDRFPHRAGNAWLALRLNQASRYFPPPLLFLVIALVAIAVRRPRNSLALAMPTIAGFVVIVLSAAGVPSTPQFSVPVAPAFILLSAGAFFGQRRKSTTAKLSDQPAQHDRERGRRPGPVLAHKIGVLVRHTP